MATTKKPTNAAPLLWSERGQIGCELPGHAPHRGSDTWIWERWRTITLNDRIDFEAELGHAAECEACKANARRAS